MQEGRGRGDLGDGLEGAGALTVVPGPGRALRSSVFEAAVNMDCFLCRFYRSFVSDSTLDSLDGCHDPGVLLDIVAF